MAAPKKAVNSRFSVKFHLVMSPDMRAVIQKDAKQRNIPEVQIIREIIAKKYGLGKLHVEGYGHVGYQAKYNHAPRHREDGSTTDPKRTAPDHSHPLEAAWGKPVLPPKEETDE